MFRAGRNAENMIRWKIMRFQQNSADLQNFFRTQFRHSQSNRLFEDLKKLTINCEETYY